MQQRNAIPKTCTTPLLSFSPYFFMWGVTHLLFTFMYLNDSYILNGLCRHCLLISYLGMSTILKKFIHTVQATRKHIKNVRKLCFYSTCVTKKHCSGRTESGANQLNLYKPQSIGIFTFYNLQFHQFDWVVAKFAGSKKAAPPVSEQKQQNNSEPYFSTETDS